MKNKIDATQSDYKPFENPIVTPKGQLHPRGRILCIEGHKDGALITVVWTSPKGRNLTQTLFERALDFYENDGCECQSVLPTLAALRLPKY